MNAALDRLASLLEAAGQNVTRRGEKIDFCCPLHGDRNPSADAKVGDKVPVVACCHVCGNGVTLIDMLEELNATDADRDLILGGKPSINGHGAVEIVYHNYTDANGVPLLRVVRGMAHGKTRIRPDGKRDIGRQYYSAGEWRWPKDIPGSKPDTKTLLYNAQAVIEAARQGGTVYLGEGERVVDALIALGLPATCNVGGASESGKSPKWTRAHADQIKNARRAVIFEDNDSPGRAHGNAEAVSLAAAGVTDVRIVRFTDLPEKSDLVDWLAPIPAPERRARLEVLIAAAPRWGEDAATEPVADRLVRASLSGPAVLAHQFERPPSLLGEGIIAVGDLVLVFGQAGTSKTWLALQLALAMADAKRWFGLETTSEPVAVGFVELELHGHAVQDRLRALVGENGRIPETFHLLVRPHLRGAFDLVNHDGAPVHLAELRTWIEANQLKVVFIDALARATSCEQRDFSPLLLALDVLRAETGCALVPLHHEAKPRNGDPGDDLDAMRGDSRLAGFPQCVIRVLHHHGAGCIRFAKVSCAGTPEPIYFAPNESGVPEPTETPEDVSQARGQKNREKILKFVLGSSRSVARGDVETATGLSRSTVGDHLTALIRAGKIDAYGIGKATCYLPPTDATGFGKSVAATDHKG